MSEFCTGEACQTMAECDTQCYWYEELGEKIKCTVCAPPSPPQYIYLVWRSMQKLVTNIDDNVS